MPVTLGGVWGSSVKGDQWSYYVPGTPIARIEFLIQRLTIGGIRLNGSYVPPSAVNKNNFTTGFTINSPSEYLIGIDGATMHFPWYRGNDFTAITWLSFRTNRGTVYGPYGSGYSVAGFTGPKPNKSTPFSYTVPSGSRIVGFQGRSGWTRAPDGENLYAIGVYVESLPPPPPPPPPPAPKDAIVKIVVNHGSNKIHSFTLETDDGETSGIYGAGRGTEISFDIPPGVTLTRIEGTIDQKVLTSISFYASDGKVHTYGGAIGTPYTVNTNGKTPGQIVNDIDLLLK